MSEPPPAIVPAPAAWNQVTPGSSAVQFARSLYFRVSRLRGSLHNHLEREIRPIPLGRRNWLFCWTELGAEHVGLIQSLISTCKLHDIHPYTYLVDVLQRIGIHPASKAEELTPRLWKEKFADNPLRSALYNGVNHVAE